MAERIVFHKKRKSDYVGNNAVGIAPDNYNRIRDIADACDLRMCDVANRLLEFAFSHVSFEEDNNE